MAYLCSALILHGCYYHVIHKGRNGSIYS
uniref:Uncharacterized protein n=1 Tax=Rhizophora mucronata TaxID=61149 RepID=A0A2P2M9L7_RHIMU